MKTIQVVASIIHQDGKILATQRGYGEYKGLWEFPGGKMEPGETEEQALGMGECGLASSRCGGGQEYPSFRYSYRSIILANNSFISCLKLSGSSTSASCAWESSS